MPGDARCPGIPDGRRGVFITEGRSHCVGLGVVRRWPVAHCTADGHPSRDDHIGVWEKVRRRQDRRLDRTKRVNERESHRPQCGHAPSGGNTDRMTSAMLTRAARATRIARPAPGRPRFDSARSTSERLTWSIAASFVVVPTRVRKKRSARLTAAASSSDKSGARPGRRASGRRTTWGVVRIVTRRSYG